jgi:N-acetylmuramoyl-L-alanine amidase
VTELSYIKRPSPNFDARTRPIDLVVLHYTGMQDAGIALARLTDAEPVAANYPGPWQGPNVMKDAALAKVSVHYVVDEEGKIYSLVPEEHRAWHAGRGSWEGEGDVNARSVGIEIVNGGHDFGLPDFTDAQIDAVIALVKDVFTRWPALNASRVVGHSDIAPERKADPGEKFPWKRLADAGVAIWPYNVAPQEPSDDVISRAQTQLAAFGYDVRQSGIVDTSTKSAVVAFQRRFRPSNLDGVLDEETLNLIGAVLRLKPVVI